MAASKLDLYRKERYQVVGPYDNDNGTDVTNYMEKTDEYNYKMKEEIIVGLTKTDGWTVDETTFKTIKYGETASYESGLGDGRNVIVIAKSDNSSVQNFYDNVHVEAQAGG